MVPLNILLLMKTKYNIIWKRVVYTEPPVLSGKQNIMAEKNFVFPIDWGNLSPCKLIIYYKVEIKSLFYLYIEL